jgi:flagellar biosynthesis chaperone FliJ
MQSFELTQPVSSAVLLKQFESRFGQTMNLAGLDKTQLEDLANSVRTKIHTITDNLHFGKELKDNEYQKSQMMLDILNQSIKEYGGMNMDPEARAAAQGMTAQKKLEKGQALTPDERKTVAKVLPKEDVKEGVEEQSELILAAKDMMDKVTGYLEDLASMKTEGMLELADRIRDEMGADKADAFIQKIQPALEQAESTLTQTRQDLDQGVRILTGEETATDTIGADTMNTDADLDSLENPEADAEADEFGATDAEAGGTEPEGREQRESKEVFETSNRIYAKLAGK